MLFGAAFLVQYEPPCEDPPFGYFAWAVGLPSGFVVPLVWEGVPLSVLWVSFPWVSPLLSHWVSIDASLFCGLPLGSCFFMVPSGFCAFL